MEHKLNDLHIQLHKVEACCRDCRQWVCPISDGAVGTRSQRVADKVANIHIVQIELEAITRVDILAFDTVRLQLVTREKIVQIDSRVCASVCLGKRQCLQLGRSSHTRSRCHTILTIKQIERSAITAFWSRAMQFKKGRQMFGCLRSQRARISQTSWNIANELRGRDRNGRQWRHRAAWIRRQRTKIHRVHNGRRSLKQQPTV